MIVSMEWPKWTIENKKYDRIHWWLEEAISCPWKTTEVTFCPSYVFVWKPQNISNKIPKHPKTRKQLPKKSKKFNKFPKKTFKNSEMVQKLSKSPTIRMTSLFLEPTQTPMFLGPCFSYICQPIKSRKENKQFSQEKRKALYRSYLVQLIRKTKVRRERKKCGWQDRGGRKS